MLPLDVLATVGNEIIGLVHTLLILKDFTLTPFLSSSCLNLGGETIRAHCSIVVETEVVMWIIRMEAYGKE